MERGWIIIRLTERQKKIISIVENEQPITGETIAEKLQLRRATLRPDLAILTMCGILDAKPKVGYFIKDKNSHSDLIQYLKEIKVNDIKSVPIVINEETSVYDAIVTLFLEDVGTLFVVKDDDLKGVISRKDLLKAAVGSNDLNKMPVGVIMTRTPKIVSCNSDEDIIEAIEKLVENDIDCLPVLEHNKINKKKIIGRISKTNITKIILEICHS